MFRLGREWGEWIPILLPLIPKNHPHDTFPPFPTKHQGVVFGIYGLGVKVLSYGFEAVVIALITGSLVCY